MSKCNRCQQPNTPGAALCRSCYRAQAHGDRRRCTRCGQIKHVGHFFSDKRFGITRSRCKRCVHELTWRDPVATREKAWRKRYGISIAEAEALLAEQGGGCAICGIQRPFGRGGLVIDHDHATGAVRGVLCQRCNSVVGHVEAGLMEEAVSYLRARRHLTTA